MPVHLRKQRKLRFTNLILKSINITQHVLLLRRYKTTFFSYLPPEQHFDDMSVQRDWTEFILKQTQAQYSVEEIKHFTCLLKM